MFKLTLEKSKVPLYRDFFPESNPEDISGFFYRFLQSFSQPIEEPIPEEQLIPVKILVTIRTDRTNEVIVPDDGKFYAECEAFYPNFHPLDDAVLLSAKSLIDRLFDCGDDIVRVIPRTVPLPVGACLLDNTVYVHMTVVVDHTLKSESFFNLKDCHYENIKDLTPSNDLESKLIDSLTIVYNMQGGEPDGNHDN